MFVSDRKTRRFVSREKRRHAFYAGRRGEGRSRRSISEASVLFGSPAAEMRIGIVIYELFRPQQSFRLKPVINITAGFTGTL